MPAFLSAFYERFGLNAYVQGDYAKAERWFRKLERLEPDSIRVLRNLGVVLLAKGDAEGAERYLLREERLYGASFHRHAALADLAYARGRRKEAERRYAAALAEPEAAPGGSQAGLRPLMEARLGIARSEESFAKARRSMERFSEAEAARERGDHGPAVALFEEAATLDPTNWPALNNAGTLLLNQLGDPARAAGLFEKALPLARSPQVARNLELALAAGGEACGGGGASSRGSGASGGRVRGAGAAKAGAAKAGPAAGGSR